MEELGVVAGERTRQRSPPPHLSNQSIVIGDVDCAPFTNLQVVAATFPRPDSDDDQVVTYLHAFR